MNGMVDRIEIASVTNDDQENDRTRGMGFEVSGGWDITSSSTSAVPDASLDNIT